MFFMIVVGLVLSGATAQAEVITIEGTIKSVDAAKRTITVETSDGAKTLDVSSKAKISNDGKDSTLDKLKAGQKVSLSYHDELEIVLKIEVGASPPSLITFDKQEQQIDIRIADKPFASYIFRDDQILRPFFANVNSLGGVQVTRNYPPVEDGDHADTQPGLSLDFADLNGADFHSNTAVVRHVEFAEEPTARESMATFVVKNSYEAGNQVVCNEDCRFTFYVEPEGVLLVWDSVFHSDDHDFYFGDSKEMGLGLRVATPLKVQNGGRIIDSQGRVNEKGVWGKQADWCQCSGIIDGQQAGVMLMPDPKNFRRAWFHARDYGYTMANPFGQFAFTNKNKSNVIVKVGKPFRLRFGVFIWDTKLAKAPSGDALYRSFLKQIATK